MSMEKKVIKLKDRMDLRPLDHTLTPPVLENPYVKIRIPMGSFDTIHARPLVQRKHMANLTTDFFESLKIPIPYNQSIDISDPTIYDSTQLVNIFILGGPGSGKTTLARSIGESIHDYYNETYGTSVVHCIESSYIPEAISAMDPSKSVFVLSIDDPMREQDARKPNDPVVDEACQSFFEIRHLLMRKKVAYQLKEYLGVNKLPKADEQLIAMERWIELAGKYPLNLVKCSGLIFTIFGPQVPQIDQRLHLGKMWEIYKAYGSLDVKRRAALEAELEDHFYIQHLKENEKLWRVDKNLAYMSRSLIKDPFGEKRCGWLWVFPPKKMVFQHIERGEHRHQERLKDETEILDEWAKYLYEHRKELHPPYMPHGMIHDRRAAINNFLRDIQSDAIDPRTNEHLSAQDQTFFRNTRNIVSALDDRISKIFAISADEEKIKAMTEALIVKAEEEDINPFQRSAQAMFRALSHRIEGRDEEFLRKKGIWPRIYDEIILQWTKKYGAPEEEDDVPPRTDGAVRVPMLAEQMRQMMKTQVKAEETNTLKFNLDIRDAVSLVLQDRPDMENGADIYCHMYSLCDKDHMTCREMSVNSMTFYGQQMTEEQIRYRKEQFEGCLNQKVGDLFELWLEAALNEGYELPGILEEIERAERMGGQGKPDLVIHHIDGKLSVGAAKCYTSQRTESFEKAEFNPELMYHSRLLRDKGKIFMFYRNLGIKDMFSVKVFDSAIEVPENVFFSPKDAGKFVFRKKEEETHDDAEEPAGEI